MRSDHHALTWKTLMKFPSQAQFDCLVGRVNNCPYWLCWCQALRLFAARCLQDLYYFNGSLANWGVYCIFKAPVNKIKFITTMITLTILHSSTPLIQFYIQPPFAIWNLQIQILCCIIDFIIWYTQSKLVTHEVYINADTRPIYYLIKAFEYSQNTCMYDYVI